MNARTKVVFALALQIKRLDWFIKCFGPDVLLAEPTSLDPEKIDLYLNGNGPGRPKRYRRANCARPA